MGAIFISYRRGDSEGQARALYADLSRHLGKDSVFMDVDSIALGRDFRHVLQERLSSCDMVLALIGPNWLDIKDEQGNRRLDSPTDFVRQELSASLKRGVPVTPVLVQGARIPPPERLPDDIQDLAYRNGFELSHLRWDSDVQEMVKRLGLVSSPSPAGGAPVREPASPATPPNPKKGLSLPMKLGAGAVGLLVVLFIIGTLSGPPSDPAPVAGVSPVADLAVVSPTEARFTFPIDAPSPTWRWYRQETSPKTVEYEWTVIIKGKPEFELEAYIYKGPATIEKKGDLRALAADLDEMCSSSDDGYPEDDCHLVPDTEPGGTGLVLRWTGEMVKAAFASRPSTVIFRVAMPGEPEPKERTVPISYSEE